MAGATQVTGYWNEFTVRLTGETRQIPADIEEWLGRLMLLYGVPFHYLVPEEDMLPPESIRFFYLDPGWLKCLLEGACSVGRSNRADDLVDQHLRNHFLDLAAKKAKKLRADKEGTLNWPLTGFLLRSRVVEGWQGLEMNGVGVDAQGNRLVLEPLRIDRLNPEIMLCIFNGKVIDIEFTQPPEDMHFGAAAKDETYQKKQLRKLPSGDSFGPTKAISVPIRHHHNSQREHNRVVNVHKLATEMKDALTQANALDATTPALFTSAEFGVQMVESPGKASFRVG